MEPREAQREGPRLCQPQGLCEDERHRSLPARSRRGGEDARSGPRRRRAQADEGLHPLDVREPSRPCGGQALRAHHRRLRRRGRARLRGHGTPLGRPRTNRRSKCRRAPSRVRASRSRSSTPAWPCIRTSRRCWRRSISSARLPCRAATRKRRRKTASIPTATARTWPASWSAPAATRPTGGLVGVAPQANLVSVRVLDGTGSGLDLGRAGRPPVGARAQGRSTASASSTSRSAIRSTSRRRSIRSSRRWTRLWDAGVVVVCSAGNSGRHGHGTISSPCNSRKVITVGRHQRPQDRGPRRTTRSRPTRRTGPTAIDLVAKPDLLAPGNRIVSLRSPGSTRDLLFPDRRAAADPERAPGAGVLRDVGDEHGLPHGGGHGRADARAGPLAQPGHGQGAADDVGAQAGGGRPLRHRRRVPSTSSAPCTPPAPWPMRRRRLAVIDEAERSDRLREHGRALGRRLAFSLWPLWSGSVIWTEPDGVLPVRRLVRRRAVADGRALAGDACSGPRASPLARGRAVAGAWPRPGPRSGTRPTARP